MKWLRAFTLIELLVVISIIALLIGILLPALGVARRTANQMTNNTQGRGIHQAMVTFAQSNKSYYPGLESNGDSIASPTDLTTDTSLDYRAEGAAPDTVRSVPSSLRAAVLLNGNFFTPDYIINPADSVTPVQSGGVLQNTTHESATNGGQSYGWLNIAQTSLPHNNSEWRDTLNSSAIILTDRNTGNNNSDEVSSVWTNQGSGEWTGMVVWNDGHTTSETTHLLENQTKFGSGTMNTTDNIFNFNESDIDGDGNAFMPWDGLTFSTGG